jgi:hypothetical protein
MGSSGVIFLKCAIFHPARNLRKGLRRPGGGLPLRSRSRDRLPVWAACPIGFLLRRKATNPRADKPHAHYLWWIGRTPGGSRGGRSYTYLHPKLTTILVVSGAHFGANRSCSPCNSIKLLDFLLLRSDEDDLQMISTWSEWKRYPRAGRGENIEAPISPGIYEVRFAGTGALHSFGAVDNVASALAMLPTGSKSWFSRRETTVTPDLEYRTCATSSKADAKTAAERMIGRRETYMSGAA